jgi:uncharacterized damage-inducible protein DinB
VVTRNLSAWPADYEPQYYPDREAIKALLAEVHGQTEAYLTTLDEPDLAQIVDGGRIGRFRLGWVIWHVLEHEIHHRGELSLVLGLLGRQGLDV